MKHFKRREIGVYSKWRRLGNRLKSNVGIIPKNMTSSFVFIGDQQYKRLKFKDTYTSENTNRILEKLHKHRFFPKVLIQHENELWLEYIEGVLLSTVNDAICEELADLYYTLHVTSPKQTSSERFVNQIEVNLNFLYKMEIISHKEHQKLRELLSKNTPEKVWTGLDYVDAIQSNFLTNKSIDTLYAIDVDSIRDDSLLGTGLIKANTIWLDDIHLKKIITSLKAKNSPDFFLYILFIQLHFRSKWLKSLFLRNKQRRLKKNRDTLIQLTD